MVAERSPNRVVRSSRDGHCAGHEEAGVRAGRARGGLAMMAGGHHRGRRGAWWVTDVNRGVQVTTGAVDRSQPTLAALTNEPAVFPRQGSPAAEPHHLRHGPRAADHGGDGSGRGHAAIITDLLRNGLARFEDITVVEVGPQSAGAAPPAAEDTYPLTGRLLRQGPNSKVSLRLRHELSQRIVWSGDFIIGVAEGQGLSETAFMRAIRN